MIHIPIQTLEERPSKFDDTIHPVRRFHRKVILAVEPNVSPSVLYLLRVCSLTSKEIHVAQTPVSGSVGLPGSPAGGRLSGPLSPDPERQLTAGSGPPVSTTSGTPGI